MNTITIETTEQGEVAVDIFQKLANDRILFVYGDINDDIAVDLAATLLLKDAEEPETKITLFINSIGGDIRNVLAIYDVMTGISSPVETICIGSAMREAAILLAAGTKGMRFATKNSVIAVGQLINIWTHSSDLKKAKSLLTHSNNDNEKMMSILAKSTDKDLSQIMRDFDRLVYMNSMQAKQYGFIDKVIKKV